MTSIFLQLRKSQNVLNFCSHLFENQLRYKVPKIRVRCISGHKCHSSPGLLVNMMSDNFGIRYFLKTTFQIITSFGMSKFILYYFPSPTGTGKKENNNWRVDRETTTV